MSFLIYTLGCKVNTYESEYMEELLLKEGYKIDKDKPDIIIVNTCSVTNVANNKSLKMVRHFKRLYPNSILVVCGCSVQNKIEDYEYLGINILIGNQKKSKIVSLINNYLQEHQEFKYVNKERHLQFENMELDVFQNQTRAYVKIQDGCDNFCSYCVIPYVRGSIRSKEFDLVVKEVTNLVNNKHKEIVLTGIHTGSYGYNTNYDLTDLIHKISELDNLKRIRISSIEITELNDKFLNELKNNPKICNHLHIPLQAGSDEILKIMNRKYDIKYFQDKINKIREIRPDIRITTDIIVGHPYETEELFLETLEISKKLDFSKIHVFPYSKRDKTKASMMDHQVSEEEKKRRSKKLVALSNMLEEKYYKKYINQTLEVLVEKSHDKLIGMSSNYLKVLIEGDALVNTLVLVEIKDYKNGILIGKVKNKIVVC